MKIITLLSLLFFVCSSAPVFATDTTHVKILHPTVVTDPSKGAKEYTTWTVFPSQKEPVRKITLFVKFACPDSMRCADWDYSDRIILKRRGGKMDPY